MTPKHLRIGTRGSALALWQARWVQTRLQDIHENLTVELLIIKTRGDKILDVPLAKVGGKGLFVKELEEALLDGQVDLAVHSMKDVPATFPTGLGLSAILEREDPRDVLLSIKFDSMAALPLKACIGSSSLRRQSQMLALRPDLLVVPLRGNVNTRIEKLRQGNFDAIVLAAAGVNRLHMTEHVVEYLDTSWMIPANGQGAVGIETRMEDATVNALVAPLNHGHTRVCIAAERAFLAALEGGCQVPIAGLAHLQGDTIHLRGRVASPDGTVMFTAEWQGPATHPEAVGNQLAENLLQQGADKILREFYTPLE